MTIDKDWDKVNLKGVLKEDFVLLDGTVLDAGAVLDLTAERGDFYRGSWGTENFALFHHDLVEVSS